MEARRNSENIKSRSYIPQFQLSVSFLMSPQFTAAFGAAGPPDLNRLFLFLTRRDATVQIPKLARAAGAINIP